MEDVILVLNAGSSSLKFSLFLGNASTTPFLRGYVEGLFNSPHFLARDQSGVVIHENSWPAGTQLGHPGAIDYLLNWGRPALGGRRITAVGHRVGHGGRRFCEPVLVTEDVLAVLSEFIPLAPLHQPHNLNAIRAVTAKAPELPQVACFDTAFHRQQPPVAQRFALPRRLTEEGVIRYGFHGLSYEYIASVLPTIDDRAAAGRTIVAHLGNGASMCALNACRSVATTMSFSALDGLPMGTRCGSLDPGVLLYLLAHHHLDVRELEKLLYSQSGLLGVSGISSDMRDLLASSDSHAREAVELFVYRIGREIGSLTAALGGLDALVFTGGIGERSAVIRSQICLAAAWLGLELDTTANNHNNGPRISLPTSCVSAWVIPANEELRIAQHTRRRLQQRP